MKNEKSLGVLPLVFFSVGCTIASGVFALSGDFAAAGAYTLATLIGWLITFVGMFGLMMCYFRLSAARPDLTSGIYTYAKAGFGEYVGFNAAWGYWISAILAYTTFHVGLFGSLSEIIPWLQDGYAIKSLILGSIILWLLVLLVLHGVNESFIINMIVVIAKVIPIAFLVIAAIFASAFSWDTFVGNWNAPEGGDSLGSQITSTCFTTVWVFIGIEGAVVISHRAKNTKLAGRSAMISFIAVFVLYLAISVISMGCADHDTLAQYTNDYTFSMAGVMEQIVGHWGAVLVNVSAIISIGCALFAYILLCIDSAAGPAENDCFPKSFNNRNKHNAPTVSIIVTAIVIELFVILATFATSSYQNCYYLSTVAIVIPYMLSAFFMFKLVFQNTLIGAGNTVANYIISILAALYGIWMFYATCIADPYVLIAALLFFPGIVVYAIKRKTCGEKLFPKAYDLIVAIVLGVLFIVAIVLIATGNEAVTSILV